jgi:3-isopropylmalate/(R)-2-methylmalate dehydratase small subunit
VWALQEAGIQAVLATSFADIFYNNAQKNGLLLITLSAEIINTMTCFANTGQFVITINVTRREITMNNGTQMTFEIDPFRQYCLINGIDDLDYLLEHAKEIMYYHQQEDIS